MRQNDKWNGRITVKDKNREKETVIKAEDIKYSRPLADEEDLEAIKRAEAADKRAEEKI
jgi:hypothetical protein